MNRIVKCVACLVFLLVSTILSEQESNGWQLLLGVWKGTIVKLESYNLLTCIGAKPAIEGLKMPEKPNFHWPMTRLQIN